MPITVRERPASLSGCWQQWSETQGDNIVKTEFESGVYRTRRRFTGIVRIIDASVTLPAEQYDMFMYWYNSVQEQGAVGTKVVTPSGNELIVQWLTPPKIQWVDKNAFRATVQMLNGSWF